MSGILSRIKIKNVKGANIAYLYQKEDLEKFGLKPNEFDRNEIFINVGDELIIENNIYRVVKIDTKFFSETFDIDNKGTNVYGIDEPEPYNFQITYSVENIKPN